MIIRIVQLVPTNIRQTELLNQVTKGRAVAEKAINQAIMGEMAK